jgi:hypothetical protein
MVKRRARSKSKSIGIQLKRRSRRPSRTVFSRSRFIAIDDMLDRNVSVRSIVKYSSITLAFIIIFAFVFMLGRFSVGSARDSGAPADNVELSGDTSKVMKSNPGSDAAPEEDITSDESTGETNKSNDPGISEMNLSDSEGDPEEADVREADVVVEGDPGEERTSVDNPEDEEPACTPKHAEFDYTYRLVEIDVSNFNKEVRGDNWATIDSLKLTITNNEHCTIINPTQIKIKLNNRGKGSVWWDDEVFLPKSFLSMKPGETVSEIVPVHVSYSDIYTEKDFRLTVFDEYDIEIGTFKDFITLS